MDNVERYGGWVISAWCWCLGHLPTANQVLVYVSIGVGVAQILYTCQRIRRDRRK